MNLHDRRHINLAITPRDRAVSEYVERLYLNEILNGMRPLDDCQAADLHHHMHILGNLIARPEARGDGVDAPVTDPGDGDDPSRPPETPPAR